MTHEHINRRSFVAGAAVTALSLVGTPGRGFGKTGASTGRFKAVAFDGFALIDPRPIAIRADQSFPGRGDQLLKAWRARQFEYTWLRTLAGRYANFWDTTQDALDFAARSLNLPLEPKVSDQLMHTFLELEFWPDAHAALATLNEAGIRFAFLSNFTAPMLDTAVANSGLQGLLGPHLSTDLVCAFKPDPRAYQMALHAFDAPLEQIVFCAAAGWDVAGAKWFGYPTVWVNRDHSPPEQLGVTADATVPELDGLLRFMGLTVAPDLPAATPPA